MWSNKFAVWAHMNCYNELISNSMSCLISLSCFIFLCIFFSRSIPRSYAVFCSAVFPHSNTRSSQIRLLKLASPIVLYFVLLLCSITTLCFFPFTSVLSMPLFSLIRPSFLYTQVHSISSYCRRLYFDQ